MISCDLRELRIELLFWYQFGVHLIQVIQLFPPATSLSLVLGNRKYILEHNNYIITNLDNCVLRVT